MDIQDDLAIILLDELRSGRTVKNGSIALIRSREHAVTYLMKKNKASIEKIDRSALSDTMKNFVKEENLEALVKEGLDEKWIQMKQKDAKAPENAPLPIKPDSIHATKSDTASPTNEKSPAGPREASITARSSWNWKHIFICGAAATGSYILYRYKTAQISSKKSNPEGLLA